MDICLRTNLDRITAQLALHTPVKRDTFRLKPWWSHLLSQLRRAYNTALHYSKVDRFDTALLASARAARTAVTGLFPSTENTIGLAIGLLVLVLREASRDRR